MNEYTRREEVRWTLIASLVMVMCIAPAVVLLVTAKGKEILDPQVQAQADEAREQIKPAHSCVTAAKKLQDEISVFKDAAKAAHLDAPDDADAAAKVPKKQSIQGRVTRKLQEKEKEPDVGLAWNAAQPSEKAAKILNGCKDTVVAATSPRAETAAAWEAIAKAAEVHPAAADPKEELVATRLLLKLLSDIPVEKIAQQTKDAEAEAQKKADALAAKAKTAKVREPLPAGLVPRQIAVGIGVGLSVIALLLSYLSVRVSSNRRSPSSSRCARRPRPPSPASTRRRCSAWPPRATAASRARSSAAPSAASSRRRSQPPTPTSSSPA